ncbi:unnamed protein product, partial [Symbiodinium sp. KB8]
GGAMHPVLAAAVTAVENYGWQAVHEGRREWTALHWAASEGNKALCARLLLHDADPSQVDQAGRSALDYARNAGHRSTYEMLWQSQQRRRRSAPAAPASASPQQEFKSAPAAYPQSLRLPPGSSEGSRALPLKHSCFTAMVFAAILLRELDGYHCNLVGGRSRKQSPDEDKEIGIHNELLASVSDLSDLELSVLGSVDLSEQPALLKELKLHGCRLFGV